MSGFGALSGHNVELEQPIASSLFRVVINLSSEPWLLFQDKIVQPPEYRAPFLMNCCIFGLDNITHHLTCNRQGNCWNSVKLAVL